MWKNIPGYEGLYQANKKGEIKSFYSGKILRSDNSQGYSKVVLRKNSKGKTFTSHKLIMLTFIGNRPNNMEINHIDKNKSNNSLKNLEYITHLENEKHKVDFKGFICPSVAKRKQVSQFTKEGKYLKSYVSIREAGRINNIYNGHISKCCKGKMKTIGGFIWKYKKD